MRYKDIKHTRFPSMTAKEQREMNFDDLIEEYYKLSRKELMVEGRNFGLHVARLDKDQLVYMITHHIFKNDKSGTYRIKTR